MGQNTTTTYPAPMIGIKADGTAVMATVTSVSEGTRSATRMKYLPYIAKELGMINCIMFDGGGSTQFITLENGSYVRRATSADGAGTTRTVISGVAAVYHGADLTVTNNENGSLNLLTSNIASTTPVETTYYNVSAIDTMNGVSDGSFAKPGAPVVTTLKGSLTSDYKLSLAGWSIVNGGVNGGINYSVDGGTTWMPTTGSYSTAEQAVLDSAKSNSTFTNISGTNGRFEVTADLSAYQGQIIDVRFATASVSGSMSHFLTVENVQVGAVDSGSGDSGDTGSTTTGNVSTAFGYYATVESINGTLTNLVGMRDPNYTSSASDKSVFILPATATGFSAPANTLSISGWAVVNGANSGKFYWSVDKINWTECTGTTVSATTSENCTTATNSGALATAATAKGAFSGATADLSAYNGQTVNVYFATVGTLSGYETSYLHFLTVEDVYVGEQSSGDSGDSGEITTTGQNSGSIDFFNGTNVTGYRAKPGNPLSAALPVPMTSTTLTIQGWCVAEGGYNGGIVYSLDGGKTWQDTSGSYEDRPADGDAIVALAQSDGLTTVTKTNCGFNVGVDLSAYKGQTVTVTFGINTSASVQEISTFATITDIAVPSNTVTYQNSMILWNQINGVEYAESASSVHHGVRSVAIPDSCQMKSTSFSIYGWAVVVGGQQQNGIKMSTDGGVTWRDTTGGTYSASNSGVVTWITNNGAAYGVAGCSDQYAWFGTVSVDLSDRAGMLTNVTVGITQADGTVRPMVTFTGVQVPGSHVCTAGTTVTSLGNGTHAYTCTGCGNTMPAVTCTANGTYTATGNGTHTSTCSVCGGTTAAAVCSGTTWASDETSHWKVCSTCSTKIDTTVAEHTGTATCQSAATCTVCNKSFGSVGTHTLVEIEGKTPTCTESGLTTGEKCSVCGTVTIEQTTIAAYGHSEVELPAIEATCTSTGLTAGSKCFDCNTILTAQTVTEKIPHNYVDGSCSMCGKADTTTCEHTYTDNCDTDCDKCGEVRVASHNPTAMGTAIDPTCTQVGYTEGYICSDCGEIVTEPEEIKALGHKNDVTIPGYAATCSQAGLTDGVKCSVCDAITTPQEEIKALGHTEQTVAGYAATCKEAGLTDGVVCSVCNNVLVEQEEIAALGHTEQALTGYAATCLEAGLTDGSKCSVCNTVIKAQEEIEALGHTEETLKGYAATCYAVGLTDGVKCSVCDTVITAQTEIAKTAHTEVVIPAVDATCTTKGSTEGKECSVCGEVTLAPTEIETVEHVYTTYTYNNDGKCGQNGTKTASCDYGCGATSTIEAEGTALSHKWSAATCTAPKTCSVCGATEGEALGHDWLDADCLNPQFCVNCGEEGDGALGHAWTDATCTAPKTCSRCTATEGVALGHSWSTTYTTDSTHHWNACINGCGEISGKATHDFTAGNCVCGLGCSHATTEDVAEIPATCTSTGTTAGKKCTTCGMITEGCTMIEKKAHTEVAIGEAKEPTCTETGITSGVKCDVCGTVITEQQTISAKGHSWKTATCTEPKTCKTCGATDGEALGHDWLDADCLNPQFCVNCGEEGDGALGHAWVAATCTEPKTCSRCTTTEGTALGHSWADATCTTPKTCSVCHVTEGAALGHSWVAADCDTPKTCSVCHVTEGAALGHKWATTYTTDDTYHWYACTNGCDEINGKEEHDLSSGTCVCGLGCSHATTEDVAEIPATCTSTGTTAGKKCTECGAITEGCTIINKKAHTEVAIGEAKEPTCTEAGITAGLKCSVCNEVFTEQQTISAKGHSWVAADCDTPKTCSVCKATEGEALGHKWTDANCTTPKTCSVCKATEGEALGHTWVDATCTTPKTCSVCKVTEGEALGHTWVDANCTTPKTCSVCKVTEGAALGHKWKDATCEEPRTCSVCQATDGEALGHNWSATYTRDDASHWYTCTNGCGEINGKAAHDFTTGNCVCGLGCAHATTEDVAEIPATCTSTGTTAGKKCTVCGTITEGCTIIDKKAHTEVAIGEAKEPTCTETGITAGLKCAVCNAVFTEQQTISAKGHSWVAADCDTPKTCSVCQATEGEALGHKWTDATCTTPKTCSVCNATEGEALGHTWVDATCTTPKTCSVCKVTEGEALGHTWVDANCTTPKTCSVCKATDGIALGHTLTQVDAKAATCTEKGWKAYEYCSVCDYTTYEEIGAKGHTEVIDGAVDATCTSTGLTEGKHCSACGEVLVEQTVTEKLDHTVVTDPAVDATCQSTGKTEGSHCGVCGEVFVAQTTTAKKEHTIVVTNAVKPTTTSTGMTSGASCSVCNTVLVEAEEIPAINEANKDDNHHNVVDGAASAPTVSAGAAVEHTPDIKIFTKTDIHTANNNTYINFIEAEKAIAKAPAIIDIAQGLSSVAIGENKKLSFGYMFEISDVAAGAENYDDGYTLTVNIENADKFAALLHYENGAWVVVDGAVADAAAGTVTFTVNSLSPFATTLAVDEECEHTSYTTEVTAPTCVSEGYTTYTCTACGETWTGDTTAATGEHSYGDDAVCDICGAKKTPTVYANIEQINSWTPPALPNWPPITGDTPLTFDWISQYGNGTAAQQLRLKLWAVAVGGQQTLAYNVNGGTWADVTAGMYQRDDIPAAFPTEDIKAENAGYEGYINLSSFAGQTISVGLAVKTASGEYVQIATIINYQVASTQFVAAIDSIEGQTASNYLVGTVGNPSQNYGALTWNFGQMSDTTLTLNGWMMISGGQQHFAYSVNGGQTWHDVTSVTTGDGTSDHTESATANGGAGNWVLTAARFVPMNIDLSAYAGKTVTVTFARVSASGVPVIFANINVTVGGAQTHTCNTSAWTAIGSGEHIGYCDTCGAKLKGTCAAGTTFGHDDNNHWNTCVACNGQMNVEAHTGGSANCQTAATCSVCNNTYGGTNTNVHTGTITWTNTETTHTGTYNCCNTVAVSGEAHIWDGNTCTKCGYVAAAPHEHVYGNNVKEAALKSAATCNAYAVYFKSCTECGALSTDTFTYTEGGYDSTNHTGTLSWVTTAETHKQVCSACNGAVVAETAHAWTSDADTVCDVCGYEREVAYAYLFSGYIDYINGVGPTGSSASGYGDAGKVTHASLFNASCPGSLSGFTLTLKGWLVVSGGHDGFVYSVNGGSWANATGNLVDGVEGAHDSVAAGDGVTNGSLTNARFEPMNIDLSGFKGQTVDVAVGFIKNGEYITFATITGVSVPASNTVWAGVVDSINGTGGFSASSASQAQGYVFLAPGQINSTTLTLQGWMFIEGGQQHFSWSVNGGQTWSTSFSTNSLSTPGDTTAYYESANAAAQVSSANWVATNALYKLGIDLSAYAGQEVTVTIARTAAADTTQAIVLAKIKLTVPGTASHNHTYNNNPWVSVGKNRHMNYCDTCGLENVSDCVAGTTYLNDSNVHWLTCIGCNGVMEGSVSSHNIDTNAPCTDGQKCTVCQYVAAEPKECVPGPAATCTSAQTCTVCGNELAAKLPHNTIQVDAKAPTCLETGWDAYEYCQDCDYTTKGEELPTVDHTRPTEYDCTVGCFCTVCNTELEAAKDAHTPNVDESTCDTEKYCTVCNTVLEAKKTHTPNIDAPTCTEDQKCKYCGMLMQENLGGHTEGEKVLLAPTCVAVGSKQIYCTRCEENLRLEEIPATGIHTPGDEATCTEAQICTICLNVLVDALDHDYIEHEAQIPNCQQIGWNAYQTCSRCDYTTKVELPKTDHSTVFVPQVDATCGENGLEAYEYCTVCDYTTKGEAAVIPATGNHTYDNNCGDADCNVCGQIRTEFPSEHTLGTPATCVAQAICSVCGTSYGELSTVHVYSNDCGDLVCDVEGCGHTRDASELVPHTYDTNCDAECNICKAIRTDITHTWSEDYITSEAQHWYQCTVCSEKKEVADHEYDNACDATCDACGYTRTVGDHVVGTPATCEKQAVCGECGASFGTLAPHTPGAEATCTDPQVCTVCGETLATATGHSLEYIAGKAATCTETGLEEAQKCSVCGYMIDNSGNEITEQKVIPSLGHTVVTDAAVDPTCTTTGLTEGSHCEVCNAVLVAQQVIEAEGHDEGAWSTILEATCTTDGTRELRCTKCGNLLDSETLPATGHEWGDDAEAGWNQTKAPTCEAAGEETRTCACGHEETRVVAKLEHTATEEWTVIVQAGCDTTGTQIKTCQYCGTTMETETIEALGHNLVAGEVVAPTCTAEGYTVYSCDREGCGHTENKDVTQATGHTEQIVPGKDATCQEAGYTESVICSVCQAILTPSIELPANEHDWDGGEITKDATCTEQGTKLYTCSLCGETKTEIIEMIDHELGYATSEQQHWKACANCSYTETREDHAWVDGVCTTCSYSCVHTGGNATCEVLAVCIYCGESYGSLADHTEQTITGMAPSCEGTGLTDGVQCSVCQAWLTEQEEIAALGHNYTTYIPNGDATCTTDGTKTAYCDNGCGKTSVLTDEGSATGHNYDGVEWIIDLEATCTEKGSMSRSCANGCGDKQTQEIPEKGHVISTEWATKTPATCTEAGVAIKSCTVCFVELESQAIPATGHSWGDDAEAGWIQTTAPGCTTDGEETRVCANGCNTSETRPVDQLGHTESDWVVDYEADCENAGSKYTYCERCGDTLQTEEIPATGHAYVETGRTQPTCTATGTITYTCENGCGIPKTESIDALGHTEVEIPAVESTCTSTGLTAGVKCDVCGVTLTEQQETPMKEHTEVSIPAVGATCTATGLTEGKKCSECGETLEEQQIVPMIPHTTTVLPGTDATCLETGIEEASQCTVCNKMFDLRGTEITERIVLSALGHDHQFLETVEAGCTTEGYDIYKCVRCDDSYDDNFVDALGHDYDDNLDTECNRCGETRLPDCDHEYDNACDGVCNICGTTRVPAEHVLDDIEGKDATCTETGLEAITECTVCGQKFNTNGDKIDEQPVIEALGHDYIDHEAKAPSCTEIGWDAYQTCGRENCGYTTYNELAALGHTEETMAAVDATCTTTGLTEGTKCSVCQTVLVEQGEIPALGHPTKDELPAKAPTCTETGLEAATKCTLCGQIFDAEGNEIEAQKVVDALGHSNDDVVIAPDCTNGGYTMHICTVCGEETAAADSFTDALGHTNTIWITTVKPTCATEGSKFELCLTCGEKTGATDTIATVPHTYEDMVSLAPTCTEAGYTKSICTTCGDEQTATLDATGHTSTEWIITQAPTCTDTGLKDEICMACGAAVTEDVVVETVEHNYVTTKTEATCTTKGTTTVTCTVCGDSSTTETELAAHVGGGWVVESDATCTAAGSKYEVCAACGQKTGKTETIEALGHVESAAVTAPTCTADGYTTYTCSVCNATRTETATGSATGHISGGWIIDSEASCTTEGARHEVCSVCKVTMNTETIGKTAHNYVTTETESTCTTKGTTTTTCTVCGDTTTSEKELADHVSGGWVVDAEPTCTTTGSKHEVCKNCGGETGNTDTIPALDHSYVTVETESSCTVAGTITTTCTVCGDTSTTEKALAAHVGGGWIIETQATCTTDGSKYEICGVCGTRTGNTETISATGHNYTSVTTEPTCTDGGKTVYTCTVCGDTYTDNEVGATGHVSGGWVVESEATCTATGSKYEICGVCGARMGESVTIDTVDHRYVAKVTLPTCTAEGYTTYTCETCFGSYTDNTVEATGHVESDWLVDQAATCETNGQKHTVCTVCGATVKTETITAEGHNNTTTVIAPTCTTQGYTITTCTVCGTSSNSDYVQAAHTPVTDAAVSATCTAPGLTEGEHCSVCGFVMTAQSVEPMLEHTYSGEFDTDCDVCGAERAITGCEHNYGGCLGTTCQNCGHVRVAPGHVEIIVPGYAATCEDTGLTNGTKCAVCNLTVTEQTEIPAKGHTANIANATCTQNSICVDCGITLYYAIGHGQGGTTWETVVAATCTVEGVERELCNDCGAFTGKYRATDKAAHAESAWITDAEATCGTDGQKHTECTACGTVINTEVISATGAHTGGKATCQSQATCSVCGTLYGEVGEHTPGAEATCANAQYCTTCGTELASKTEHSFMASDIVTQPTCIAQGEIRKVCSCGAETIELIPATGTHTPGAPATCTEGQICTVCQQILVNATGHKGGNATCMAQATCSVCGEKYGRDDENAHSYTNSCDEYCNECGLQRAASHNETTVTGQKATCIEDGLTDGVMCSACGEILVKQEVIKATGHSFTGDTCDNCGTTRCARHVYDNRCDAICNNTGCGYEREVINHYYTSDCDADCNECGATRVAGKHTYSNACDTTCDECGATRTVGAHTYSYACDAICNECGATRTASHIPTGATCKDKATCSICGIVCGDTTSEHRYDNSCDIYCNDCGEQRTATHSYRDASDGFYHWTECSTCHAKKDVEAHVYENDCDSTCACGYERVTAGHTYDNACDVDCNECGATRTAAHRYSNACDSICDECGDTSRVVEDHVYDYACDTTCNECGNVRVAEHSYDNACDADCNECGEERAAAHAYDNDCDETCNTCGDKRAVEHKFSEQKHNSAGHWLVCECGKTSEYRDHIYANNCADLDCDECGFARSEEDLAEHEYSGDCDDTCNGCGEVRTPEHTYSYDCDVTCNKCGSVREVDENSHVFEFTCSQKCYYCDFTDTTREHVYDHGCDVTCNNGCGYVRIPEPHVYSADCSVNCAICNAKREVPVDAHTFEFDCSERCMYCDYTRTDVSHKVSSSFTNDAESHWKECTVCGKLMTKVIPHNYYNYVDLGDGTHQMECRNCKYISTAEHTYKDGKCSKCKAVEPVETMAAILPEKSKEDEQ
ncbi:MAG: phosphodiester glycosidase family protein [Clostridia bacterium]|nr:phosphodiester glycosidase family protein [Clostridia bacterium]